MKKRILALTLALCATFSLTSCGGGSSSTPPTTPPTTPPAGSSAAPGSSTPAQANDLGKIEDGAKLVYWSMWGETEPQGMVINEAIDAFAKATGVEVEVQFGAGRATRKTLEPALSAGEIIDLFDEDIERVLGSWGDYLLPLDEYVAASYDGTVYRDSVNKTLINLVEEMGASSSLSGGQIYNIPYQPSTFVVMYNKGLFDKAGITDTPKNWEEFVSVCEKLKGQEITAITIDDAYMAAFFGYNMDRLIGSEKTYAMAENLDFSDPAVLKFGQIWQDMTQKGYMSKNAATNIYPNGQTAEIAKETVAMYLNGTWLPNEIKGNNPNIKWGSFAWPAMDPAGDGIEANNYSAQSFGINKNTQYPNAAFALVRWLTTGEWDEKLAAESLGVPMGINATWPAETAEAEVIINGTTKRLTWAVSMEDKAEANTAIKSNLAKLINGDIDAQGFADAMSKVS